MLLMIAATKFFILRKKDKPCFHVSVQCIRFSTRKQSSCKRHNMPQCKFVVDSDVTDTLFTFQFINKYLEHFKSVDGKYLKLL